MIQTGTPASLSEVWAANTSVSGAPCVQMVVPLSLFGTVTFLYERVFGNQLQNNIIESVESMTIIKLTSLA